MFNRMSRGGRACAAAGITATAALACAAGPAAAAQSRIVFSRDTRPTAEFESFGLFTMTPDGKNVRQLTKGQRDFDPRWSRDRKHVVFVTEQFLTGNGIEVANANGSHRHSIGQEFSSEPDWSPSGTRIVYVSSAGGHGGTAIFKIGPHGRHMKRLTPYGAFFNPAWSPNGKLIAYEGKHSIFTMHPDGSHRRKLIYLGRRPDWSPDGQHIAFQRGGNVYVALANGHNVRRLTGGGRGGSHPAWSPDGQRIAFQGKGGGIWVMDKEGQGAVQLNQHGLEPDW